MKIKLLIVFALFIYQNKFFAHNLDRYTVLYPDLIEIVEQQCKFAESEQKLIIENHVKNLMDDVVSNKNNSKRTYSFFSVENEFHGQKNSNESYSFYVVLYVEFESNILDKISQRKKDRIQKLIVKNLLKLYESKSIGFKKVLPGCYVSCVEIGIDVVSKNDTLLK